MKQLNVRVPAEIVGALEEIAREERLDKAAVVRRFLLDGIERWRLEHALNLYRAGRITKERAAEMAGVTLYEFLELVQERGIPAPLSVAEALEEVKAIVSRHEKT